VGHHYIPQRYLQNFSVPDAPGEVWICDKKTGKARQAAIKAVAQEAGFYAPEVEKQLNTRIEMPGNRVIDKLLRAKPISEEERLDLSVYIATMLKRVPHRRKKAYALIPTTVEDTKQKLPQRITELAVRRGLPLADPEQALTEANRVVEGILTSVPKPIEDYIRTPWPSQNMVMAIFTMNWLVIKAPPTGFFITSDNPAVFNEAAGLATDQAELMFPLSPRFALHGNRQQGLYSLGAATANEELTREVNRWIASGVTRFAFCHEDAKWMAALIQEKRHYLRQIRFTGPKLFV
jgi:hypothetical protein